MKKPNVVLHIGELVLHGFDPADRHRIGDAVQNELARLLAERGLSMGHKAVAAATALQIQVARNAPARTLGAKVARALYGVIKR